MKIIIDQLPLIDLEKIRLLWEKLNRIHAKKSPYFSNEYSGKTFAEQKKEFILKAHLMPTTLFTALDKDKDYLAGYCFASAEPKMAGEVDSLYVDEFYRSLHLGQDLLKRAINWMDEIGVHRKIIEVYTGNEDVLPF